ncbi:MAG: arylsulfatase [Opitutaceae bacterium]
MPNSKNALRLLTCLATGALSTLLAEPQVTRPNVILIVTDDQGYGDFGVMGNTVIETPHLDAMAGRSVRWGDFYVSPVCSPTRASLMTGRYNFRTGVLDTWLGRSMMATEETTVAEILREEGYATGIFGKWHLGDNYPMRAMDQGFEESLVTRGSGLGFPSDPIESNQRYSDPILIHNGREVRTKGYCTNVYFTEAIRWMRQKHTEGRPFFAYIPTNAPHAPYHDVPDELRQHYLGKNLASLVRGPVADLPKAVDVLSRIAAMITNIDENIGLLFAALKESGLYENTLVVFLTDNGPAGARFVGPFRGQKTEVLEGGIRTPMWAHWPARLPGGRTVEHMPAAHIDLMPTLLEACGAPLPSNRKIDGRSVLTQLLHPETPLPDRPLVIQTHRVNQLNRPQRYHNFMLREGKWKLVHPSGFTSETMQAPLALQLYDLSNDPGEQTDLARQMPDLVERLRSTYDRWYDDVMATVLAEPPPPPIMIDAARENPVVLTWQERVAHRWVRGSVGFWKLELAEEGLFDVQVDMPAAHAPRGDWRLILAIGGQTYEQPVSASSRSALFSCIQIPTGQTQLRADLVLPDGSKEGGYQVRLTRR